MIRLSRAIAILERQGYLVRGSVSRVVPLFGFVVLDIVLWGFLTQYLNVVSAGRVDFVPTLLGAVVLWDFFNRVMHGVTMTFFEDVWSRNFLNIFASPMSIGEYLAGQVMSSVVTSAVGLLAMVLVAAGVFGLSYAVYGLLIVPFVLVLFLFGIALGILGSSLVLRLGPSAEWFVWPIPMLVSPFAGVFYPVATLPGWMHPIAYAMPAPYVFEAMRGIVAGQPFRPALLATGAVLAVGYIGVACWVFARVHRHAVRTGLIARYSAETIT
jgi:ABC-2 type transport system permease protein